MKIEIKKEIMADFLKKAGFGKLFDDVHITVNEKSINAVGADKTRTVFYNLHLEEGQGLKIQSAGSMNIQQIASKAMKVIDSFDEDILIGTSPDGEILIKDKVKQAKLESCDDKLVTTWNSVAGNETMFNRSDLSLKGNKYTNGIKISMGTLVNMVKDANNLNFEFYKFSYNLKKKTLTGKVEAGRNVIQTNIAIKEQAGLLTEIDHLISDGFRDIVEAIKNSCKEVWMFFEENSVLVTDKKSFYYILVAEKGE